MRRGFLLLILPFLLGACQTLKQTSARKAVGQQLKQSPVFKGHFTGFALYDPSTSEFLFEQQIDKHFTPASNTKLFTFYAGLKMLGDSIPGLQYTITGDSLIFWGTGDPTFLNDKFPHQPVYDFLKTSPHQLYFAANNYIDTQYGPGWSWDDYNDYYQAERSAFPIYGNITRFKLNGDSLPDVIPGTFKQSVVLGGDGYQAAPVSRSKALNLFFISRNNYNRDLEVPFITYPELVAQLLMDTLKRKVKIVDYQPQTTYKTVYSQHVDQVYQWMLQASDNFLAEQLLVTYASTIDPYLSGADAIGFAQSHYLDDLTDEAIWVDGSGLSRYNLFTPRGVVELLAKITDEIPQERLFKLLPAGGESGTIKKWYAADGEPYVFAKTGTLRNNHCLSGYLKADSGRVLIFSFMNNNYAGGSTPVKQAMQDVLETIRLKY